MMLKTPQTPGGLEGPGKLVRKVLLAEDSYAPDFDACKEFYVSICMFGELVILSKISIYFCLLIS